MSIRLTGLAIMTVGLAQPAATQQPATALDFLAGQWALEDAAGTPVGSSTILIQAPEAMLYEERTVADEARQPLWFGNSKANGWVQYFVGAAGKLREFRQQSPPGGWPVVMGGNVILRDGTAAMFRLTITKASNDLTRRLLERSTDGGKSWSGIFDLTYRRQAGNLPVERGR